MSINPQIQALRRDAESLLRAPGARSPSATNRFLTSSASTHSLTKQQCLTWDFFPTLERIVQNLPKTRQTLLFSATMPAEIRRLTHEVLKDPETIQAGSIAPVATVAHALYPVPQHLKTALLMELLKTISSESVLVFTRKQSTAQSVLKRCFKRHDSRSHPSTETSRRTAGRHP